MEALVGMIFIGVDKFILVFVRMTGLFVISPVFGRRNIPAYLKIGFSFITALLIINTVKIPQDALYENIPGFAYIVLKEFLVGLILGFVSYMIFSAIYFAGQLIDMQTGFGIVNVLDPLSNIQVPITSNFYFIITMLVFISANGHHALIRALYDSFEYVPPGTALFGSQIINDVVRLFGDIFVLGFRIAAPVTAAMIIVDVALGVISKTVPQLNVFVIGMPVKIFIGIAVIMITMPVFIALLNMLFGEVGSEMVKVISDMKAGN